jgi:hypothetical protein
MTATIEAPTEELAEVPIAERMAALPVIKPGDITWPHGTATVRRVTVYAPEYRVNEPVTVLATRRTGATNTWVLLPDRSMEHLWATGWGHDSDIDRAVRDRYPYTRGVFLFQEPNDDSRVFDIGEPLPITATQAEPGVQYLAIVSADMQRGGAAPQPVPFPVVVNDEKNGWKHAETGAFHRGSHISIVDFGTVEEPPTDPVERAVWERDKAQRELVAFKALVARRLVDETNSRNWCSEAEGWLRSLGLEPPPERYRVTVTLFVEDATSTENALNKLREEFGARVYEMGSARKSPR